MAAAICDVRFTLNSGHRRTLSSCPLRANKRHRGCDKKRKRPPTEAASKAQMHFVRPSVVSQFDCGGRLRRTLKYQIPTPIIAMLASQPILPPRSASSSTWGGPISIKEQSPDHVDEKDCDKGIPYHLTEPDSRIVVVGVRSLPAHDAL